jgi:ketosteroid isomerase-like protein
VITDQNDDLAAIEALVRKQGENFKKRDSDSQLALWDSDYPRLTLLPTEREVPLRGWPEIREYYVTMMPRFGAKRWDITSLKIDLLSEDLAFAHFAVEGEAETSLSDLYPESGAGADVWLGRGTYILRRTDKGWKIIHCEDSTLDLFRVYQLWDNHKEIASKAAELLRSITSDSTTTSG